MTPSNFLVVPTNHCIVSAKPSRVAPIKQHAVVNYDEET